jgi:6-bladed beta-propeller
MLKKSREACAILAIGVTILAGGCGTPTPPNPFTIAARWSAAALGLSAGMHALAIGPDGNLYVTASSQRVIVISPTGHFLRRWGGLGTGSGEFHFISTNTSEPLALDGSLAVDSQGLVYVSDSGNARIQVFTPEGRFVRQFGSFGYGPGEFDSPADLTVDGAGNVYVLDAGRPGVVNKFSPGGNLVWQVGGATSPDPDLRGHLDSPGIDQHDRLVMVDDDTGGIIYLDPENGHKVDGFDPVGTAPTAHWCEVSVDALGDTFLTGCGPPQASKVFDRTHTLIGEWEGGEDGLATAPRFGPNGEVFARGWDGSLLELKITLPGS